MIVAWRAAWDCAKLAQDTPVPVAVEPFDQLAVACYALDGLRLCGHRCLSLWPIRRLAYWVYDRWNAASWLWQPIRRPDRNPPTHTYTHTHTHTDAMAIDNGMVKHCVECCILLGHGKAHRCALGDLCVKPLCALCENDVLKHCRIVDGRPMPSIRCRDCAVEIPSHHIGCSLLAVGPTPTWVCLRCHPVKVGGIDPPKPPTEREKRYNQREADKGDDAFGTGGWYTESR